MEVAGMKTLITLMCLFILFGCERLPVADADTIAETFSEMHIDTERMIINHVEPDGDIIESIDARDKDAVLIHRIDNFFKTDEMVLITPDWIYVSATMKKTPNPYDPHDAEDFKTLMAVYTVLYDPKTVDNAHLLDLALSLKDASFHRTGRGMMLRGHDPETETDEETNAMVEIRYSGSTLLELSFRTEYDFPSTKKESNFIRGVHWTFGESIESAFPSLDEFTP